MRYFTWFDGVMSSASFFDIPTHDPARYDDKVQLLWTANILQPVQTLVRVERLNAAGDEWQSVDADSADLPNQHIRVRAVHDGAVRFDYSSGKTVESWLFAAGIRIRTAWTTWSIQLREAAYAELRLRGNHLRQRFFHDTVGFWTDAGSGQRDLAPLKGASYLEPYWFADDPIAARYVLRSRIGCSKFEFDYRRSDHHYPRASTSSGLAAGSLGNDRSTVMGRLDCPWERACYMCPESSWMPENASHVLLNCPHPHLVRERTRMKAALVELCQSTLSLPDCPPMPNLEDPCSLYFILQLATSVGPSDHHEPPPDDDHRRSIRLQQRSDRLAAAADTLDLQRRQNQWLPVYRARASASAQWTAHLTSQWRRAIARETEWEPAARAGSKLVNLVASYHRRIISLRRRVLQKDLAFLRRRRDPARSAVLSLTAGPRARSNRSRVPSKT